MRVGWAKRVWSAWVAGGVPEEVDERITVAHQGVGELRTFLRRLGPSVLFVVGDHGEGKSHLLKWAVEEARKRGERSAYVLCRAGSGWKRGRGLLLSGLEGWSMRVEEVAWPDADMWFNLARVAKQCFPERFPPIERRFMYKLGVYAANGWALSDAQRRWAEQVVAEAIVCDAIPGLTESFLRSILERCASYPVWAIDEADDAMRSVDADGTVLATLGGLAELVACGRLPFRLILAVTPELLARVQGGRAWGKENLGVVRLPALDWEEAVSLFRVVKRVFEVATGRSYGVEEWKVREWLRKYPKRRAFIQRVVQALEHAARA